MSILRPSPAVTVSDHTSIGETIQILIEYKVGAVIVTSYSAPHKPVGMFTERDILKWVANFKDNNQWTIAVGTIMTKKLITLSILNLDQANELMLKNNIRHLPIVYHDEKGEEHLAGIVSMRDAFRALVEDLNQLTIKVKEAELLQKQIMMIAKNTRDRNLQRSIFSAYQNLKILDEDFENTSQLNQLIKLVLTSDVLVFDIDDFPVKFWSQFLKLILDQPKHPHVYVVFNPHAHEKASIDALMIIAKGKVVHAFSKPLSLLQYLSQIKVSLSTFPN